MSEYSQSDAEVEGIPRMPLVFSPHWEAKEAGFWCQQRIVVAVVAATLAATGWMNFPASHKEIW